MPTKIKYIVIINEYRTVSCTDLSRFENKMNINVITFYDEWLKQFPVKVSSKMKL